MKVFFSPKCLEYNWPGHPESPERVRICYETLKLAGYEFIEPEPCTEEDLLTVHYKRLVMNVKLNNFFDPDTPNFPRIFEFAKLSVGGALKACDLAMGEENALSLMRPPGHHANAVRVAGFCYFNNIAIAVKKALNSMDKVAILDIDAHHGNGTQDIFMGEERVLYVSIHQSPLFPGTGLISEKNCVNFPVPPNTGDDEYIKYFNEAVDRISEFNPDLLGISLGFDTLKSDPLTFLELTPGIYSEIGEEVSNLGLKTFCVFEGGYSRDVGEALLNFVKKIIN
ncbi:histone deacetylase [bacterium]|nr:histone deacetylase [bacterium]